ncbi:MAG: HAMP domain-containing histidine kinase [Bacteroidetes bacterium]|nr:HAMP domain-containing histidine kinase [Bacteroidota bacterium]
MDKHYSIYSSSRELICDNLVFECKLCFQECNSLGKQILNCPKYGGQRRQGKITNTKGTTFLCDKTKTTKLFRDKLEALSYAFYDLQIPRKQFELEAKQIEQQRVNRLIHNLTSLNAHNIQEIDDFIPQELLASNYQDLLKYIQDQIKRDSKNAALMFLRIAKHNVHMKSEFSIYNKLDRLNAELKPTLNPIRKVILNVLHTFFIDFNNQNIYVYVSEFKGRVKIDYESIQVALYHLIENATKYTMSNTDVQIKFEEKYTEVDVHFIMKSLYLEDDEVEKIFGEGYSGKVARECKLNGDGIGMWQINRMLKLNNGSVKFINGKDIEVVRDKKFATNQITLTFKKN